jgi:hypothetical protein
VGDVADNGLAAFMDVDVFDDHLLMSAISMLPQGSVAPMPLKVAERSITQRLSVSFLPHQNSLKSQVSPNLNFPFSNIRAATSKLCRRSSPR